MISHLLFQFLDISEGDGETLEEHSKLGSKIEENTRKHTTCSDVGCFFCAIFVKDDCRRNKDVNQQEENGEDEALFCTLCNAEVHLFFFKNQFTISLSCEHFLGYLGNCATILYVS